MTSPALLTKAVAVVKADKAKALDEFNEGVCGFKDRDLYVFCANASDGKIVAVLANPNVKSLLGTPQRNLKGSTGRRLARNRSPQRRSRNFNSRKSRIRFRSRARTRRQLQRLAS
jgi:hypothetical protein